MCDIVITNIVYSNRKLKFKVQIKNKNLKLKNIHKNDSKIFIFK